MCARSTHCTESADWLLYGYAGILQELADTGFAGALKAVYVMLLISSYTI